MALPSIQRDNLRTHLQERAIYRDRSNVIRLLSICGGCCIYVYVYVSLTNLRSSMHGSVIGLTRRDVFGADVVFVERSVKEWMGNQHQHDASTDSSSVVSHPSCDSRPAQPQHGVDFLLICSRHTITRRASHG
jgi:hypothetical protein